jgi:outer membrane protein TolC
LRAAVCAASFAAALASAQSLSFDEALALAAQRSEAARAARAAAAGAAQSAHAAGQLPDPLLRAGIDSLPVTGADRFDTRADSATMKRVGISQEWLSADKRAARAAAARALAEREAVAAAGAEAQARLQTALAYVDAWYAGQALALALEAEQHVQEELALAQARLAAADAAGADVLQQAAARGRAEDDSDDARQQQASALRVLERWVGFRPGALSDAPAFDAVAEADYVARHPAVAALARELELARRNAAVAARERSPNWTWEVSYGQRTGYADMVSVGVSIPLPVAPAQRQDRETAARLALIDKAQADWAEAARAATGEYLALSGDAQALARRIERYPLSVALPARQRTAAALAAYRSNQGALAAVFDARHAEWEAQRKLLALQRERARAQAQLAFTPLTAEELR